MKIDSEYPAKVEVTIEIPRWSFVKYQGVGEDSQVEFVSIFPTPFNYGYVEELAGGDNAPLDAVVLGKRIRRGESVRVEVKGIVHFLDAGCIDDKLICSETKLTRGGAFLVRSAFVAYSWLRKLVNLVQGRRGKTAFLGLEITNFNGGLND